MKIQKERHYVGKVDEMAVGKSILTEWNGREIGVFNINGKFHAWLNICPHAAAPVCEGEVCGTRMVSDVYQYEYGRDGEILRCPWHGWEFDLINGEHLVKGRPGQRGQKLKGFEVHLEDGHIYLT